jgi:sulfur-carrier protein adenylyltransferase/sulfurtransferase
MAKILIPTPLRQYADRKDSVQIGGATVGEALTALTGQYQELRRHLYNDEGKLRSFVNVYVNDEDIRYLKKEATPLSESDTVSIVPSIAGGAVDTLAPPATLSKDEILRYSRHLIMPEVGMDGQVKLKNAKVLLVGTGGLGAPLGLYLAAAGIGKIGLVDFDIVDVTNLQRQVIHGTKDIGRKKLDSAADRMRDINPYLEIVKHEVALASENALDIIKDYDMVVDGTDNFPTRYLVNDACVIMKKPNVYGSIFRFEGQASVFGLPDGPCYRCLYPEPPPPGLVPSCAEGGVLGVLPGIIGSIQANETVKLILGGAEPLKGRLLLFDAWKMTFRELKLRRDPQCPMCGPNATIKELIDYEAFCGVGAVDEAVPGQERITATELKRRIDQGQNVQVIDVREPHEYAIARIPNSKLVPLGDVVTRIGEFDPSRDAIVHCKSGKRSAKAIQALRDSGYKGPLVDLEGGIVAWAKDVDPSVPLY